MSTKYNFSLDQGSVFDVSLSLTDPVTNGTIDVTQYVGASQFRRHYTSNTAYDFDVSLANGAVFLHMDSSASEDIDPGRYMYDIEVKNTQTLQTYRVAEGIVTVTPNITRAS